MKVLKVLLGIIVVLALCVTGAYFYVKQDFPKFCENTVPIFAYHRVEPGHNDPYTMPPKDFEEQMKYLKEELGYKTLTLAEYVKGRKEGRTFHKECVLIFDDGYLDNLTYAAPILKKYGFVGNMYMAVKYEGWPGYLDWHQEHELLKYGWALGSHTMNHKPLESMTPEQVDYELTKSMEHMRGIYNPPEGLTFSYPNGSSNKRIAEQVRKAGYIAGVDGKVGVNGPDQDLMLLRRVNVFQNQPENIGCFQYDLKRAQVLSYIDRTGLDSDKVLKLYYKALVMIRGEQPEEEEE